MPREVQPAAQVRARKRLFYASERVCVAMFKSQARQNREEGDKNSTDSYDNLDLMINMRAPLTHVHAFMSHVYAFLQAVLLFNRGNC